MSTDRINLINFYFFLENLFFFFFSFNLHQYFNIDGKKSEVIDTSPELKLEMDPVTPPIILKIERPTSSSCQNILLIGWSVRSHVFAIMIFGNEPNSQI